MIALVLGYSKLNYQIHRKNKPTEIKNHNTMALKIFINACV